MLTDLLFSENLGLELSVEFARRALSHQFDPSGAFGASILSNEKARPILTSFKKIFEQGGRLEKKYPVPKDSREAG